MKRKQVGYAEGIKIACGQDFVVVCLFSKIKNYTCCSLLFLCATAHSATLLLKDGTGKPACLFRALVWDAIQHPELQEQPS